MEDLPVSPCCGKPHITAEVISECSDSILKEALSSLDDVIEEQFSGIFALSAPTIDEEAQTDYANECKRLNELRSKILSELSGRERR